MRTAKLQLAAVLAAGGVVALAGLGAVVAVGRPPAPGSGADPGTVPAGQKAKDPPDVTKPGDVTAFPDLDPKGLEDLVTSCPKLFGGPALTSGPRDEVLAKLRKARANAALAELADHVQLWKAGNFPDAPADVLAACERAVAAVVEVHPHPRGLPELRELKPWYEERVRVAKWAEKVAAARAEAGQGRQVTRQRATYSRLDAEIALLELIGREKALENRK
jgi:hypothetical protein